MIVAITNDKAVNICGGFRSQKRGFCVEICEDGKKRYSTSIWNIIFKNEDEANQIFQKFFGVSAKSAYNKDRKKIKIETVPLFKRAS